MLFDFGGTLDADGVTWKERMRRLYEEEGHAVAPGRFDPAFYAADDALVGAVGARATLGDTVDRLAADVQAGLGLPGPDVASRVAARFTAARARGDRPGHACPRGARGRRYRLGVVSNFYGNLATVCDDVGVRPLFGVLVDSVGAGRAKPDPRIFRAALDALGVAPARAVFVGDSLPRDMAGARALGMPHVWLSGRRARGRAVLRGRPGDPHAERSGGRARERGGRRPRAASSPRARAGACARRAGHAQAPRAGGRRAAARGGHRQLPGAGITPVDHHRQRAHAACVAWAGARFPGADLRFIVQTTASSLESFRAVLAAAPPGPRC